MTAIGSLLAGAVFGLALAAPPGPMNAIIAEESVLRGWAAGFRAGLGAMSADVLFCVLALLGAVTVVERAPTLQTAMIAVGGLLMCYFAYGALQDARSSFVTTDGRTGDASENDAGGPAGFTKTFALSLTNPYQILFWLTIGIGLLRPGELDVLAHASWLAEPLATVGIETVVVQTGSPALLFGFFGGITAWILSYPAALVAVGERIDAATPAIATLSAAVLAGFGVWFLFDAITTLL